MTPNSSLPSPPLEIFCFDQEMIWGGGEIIRHVVRHFFLFFFEGGWCYGELSEGIVSDDFAAVSDDACLLQGFKQSAHAATTSTPGSTKSSACHWREAATADSTSTRTDQHLSEQLVSSDCFPGQDVFSQGQTGVFHFQLVLFTHVVNHSTKTSLLATSCLFFLQYLQWVSQWLLGRK